MCVVYELHPHWLPQPLRLPDDTFTQTPFHPRVFGMDVLSNFPVPQLRLFGTLIVTSNVACWKGMCAGSAGSGCSHWTDKDARHVLGVLDKEMECARGAVGNDGIGAVDGVGVRVEKAKKLDWVVTIAWMRE